MCAKTMVRIKSIRAPKITTASRRPGASGFVLAPTTHWIRAVRFE